MKHHQGGAPPQRSQFAMPPPINRNLYALIRSRFPDREDAVFLEHEGGVVFYREIDARAARIGAVLRGAGVSPGDRVCLQVEKSAEAVLLYLACLRMGAVCIPLNVAYTRDEVAYFLADAGPRVLVCAPERQEELAGIAPRGTGVFTLDGAGKGSLARAADLAAPEGEPARRTSDDLAAIVYTSGTTGRSKGAMLTHGNLSSNALALWRIWHWQQGDVLLHALPIFHVHGLFVALHTAMLNGSKVIFQNRFDAGRVIERLGDATVLMGVPTFYTRLLDHPKFSREACAGMRLFISGSAPLLPETFARFEQVTGQRILERYGMSEAGMITSNPYEGERVPGTVGFALPDVQVRVADEHGRERPRGEVGVLEFTGPNVFAGYWKMPEKTAAEMRPDGWFITGDLAVMDGEGRVSIVGRARDLVISGGYNVYPREVEEAIDALPGVLESAVIGLPHDDLGEAVAAVVVARSGASVAPDDVLAGLRGRLARYKQPRRVFMLDALPRNTMGKVQKNLLRERFARAFSG